MHGPCYAQVAVHEKLNRDQLQCFLEKPIGIKKKFSIKILI